MQLASLVGFGLVFLVIAWSLSIALRLCLWASRPRLQRLGAAAERRAVEAVVLLPPLFSALVAVILTLQSQFGADHCEQHVHHFHLCLEHGAIWIEQSWAAIAAIIAFTIATCRIVILAVRVSRQQRIVARLRTVSQRRDGIWWIDTDYALCFVSGFLRPDVYVSRGVWDALDDEERAAMLAHELGHVTHRDVARRLAVDVLLLFGAPFGSRLLVAWESATERLCDARAVAATGDGDSVASALVKVCRLRIRAGYGSASFAATPDTLSERVNAVLASEPTGDRAALLMLAFMVSVVLALGLIAAMMAEDLHHILESLLR